MGKDKAQAPTLPRIRCMSRVNLTRSSRCNSSSSRYCYRAREHVDPTLSRKTRCGADRHPEAPSSPGKIQVVATIVFHSLRHTKNSRSRIIVNLVNLLCVGRFYEKLKNVSCEYDRLNG